MSWMLLMMEDPAQRGTRTEAEGRALYDRMVAWGDELAGRGLLRASESLAGLGQAARVRRRDGRAHVVDGPFAEVKEMVGGFFLVDCDTREEAIALARECPAAEWLTVEVRALAPCHADAR